ncbi:unnamed protein product [Adineta ricciae]|uniref:EGF-like domain-containing protein n=1 Tax=Adineta ricciae TaxID=249248 RepID=A0A815RTB9_ADIRI|nr:unnamed protein product [Adineta ricciae]CAF1529922.1 unnamed protein product [Adineta ricciae]
MYSSCILLLVFIHSLIVNAEDNYVHREELNERSVVYCGPTSNPCLNGGTCLSSISNPGFFESCSCATGWAGPLCDYPDASTSACSTNPCYNGGSCQIHAGGGFRCTCLPNFTGFLCEAGNVVASNVCNPNPCANGRCCPLPSFNTFFCQCLRGWTGTLCDYPTGIPRNAAHI